MSDDAQPADVRARDARAPDVQVEDSLDAATVHLVARCFWMTDYRRANPGVAAADAEAAWAEAAPEFRKLTRAALRRMEKRGLRVVPVAD